ncbi:hypothetical protein BV133_2143 [Blastochloris viridis]|uniref:Uncharacterized protein n=1 Tax=Blastochloris viridis TaxID=1079 RepID=A0A182D2J3_BLAVI|nr:hypothetical protein BV133_2143 [Blastochloris viridis]
MLLLSLPPSASIAQPELQRLLRDRDTSVVPRLPRVPYRLRSPLDAPFRVPVPRSSAALAPQDVLAILSVRNLALVGELRRRGDYYVMEARGPRGEAVRLVVNAFSGVVEGVRVLGPKAGREGRGAREGGHRERLRDGAGPEEPSRGDGRAD